MHYKSGPALMIKAPGSIDDTGVAAEFTAMVSVFGNADSANDVVMPGAFSKSLHAWQESGNTIPVLWSHRVDDPRYNIGSVTEIAELSPGDDRIPKSAHPWVHENGGLWVKGLLDSGEHASDVALAARNLMKGRRVTQFSFAYDVVREQKNAAGQNELHDLWLYEVSPTQVGCNELTDLGAAKAGSVVVPSAHAETSIDHDAKRRPPLAVIRQRIALATFSIHG